MWSSGDPRECASVLAYDEQHPFISQMVKEKELAADGRETPSAASSTASSSFSFASHDWARFKTTVDLERTNAAIYFRFQIQNVTVRENRDVDEAPAVPCVNRTLRSKNNKSCPP